MPDIKRKNIVIEPMVNTFLRLGPEAIIQSSLFEMCCGITCRFLVLQGALQGVGAS